MSCCICILSNFYNYFNHLCHMYVPTCLLVNKLNKCLLWLAKRFCRCSCGCAILMQGTSTGDDFYLNMNLNKIIFNYIFSLNLVKRRPYVMSILERQVAIRLSVPLIAKKMISQYWKIISFLYVCKYMYL